MNKVDIFRGTDLVASVEPDNASTQVKQVMGENTLNLVFTLNHYIEFRVGDSCTVFGEKYILSDTPIEKKSATTKHDFTLKFTHEGQDLAKFNFLFLDNQNNLQESEFSLMGDAKTLLRLVVDNANRVQPGQWQVGQCVATEAKLLTFSKESCLSALTKIAEAFSTEFWILGKIVHLNLISINKGYTFKYGQYRGLYDITRQGLNGSSVITRLYAFGSDKNLPPTYKGTRLHMPLEHDPCLVSNVVVTAFQTPFNASFKFRFSPATGAGITGLTILARKVGSGTWSEYPGLNQSGRTVILTPGLYEFKFRTEGGACAGAETAIISGQINTVQLEDAPIPYLEKNTDLYGVIEWTEFFDVYPHRTGAVTSVNAANVYQFADLSMDFDVNDYELPGATAKITFNTGQLAGLTFDIATYDAANKLFTINKNKDERNLDAPSEALRIAVGDEYVITDIQMPQSYIANAEAELRKQAQAFLDRASEPQYQYNVTVDPLFIKRMQWKLFIGMQVLLKDEQLGIDKKIRIVQTTRNIVNENEYQVQLAETVKPGTLAQIQAQGSNNSQSINGIQQQLQNAALFNNKPVGDWEIQQGTVIAKDIPHAGSNAGLLPVYFDPATGKLVVVG